MKHSKPETFLDGLSENEIAFFVVYKMPRCLSATRKKIKSELAEIDMDMVRAKTIVDELEFTFPDAEHRCPRCGSGKCVPEDGLPERQSTTENAHCLVCGYHPHGRDGRPRRRRILRRWWR